ILAASIGNSYIGGAADCSKLTSLPPGNEVPEPRVALFVLLAITAGRSRRRWRYFLGLLLVVGFASSTVWADTRYILTDLGTLGGLSSSAEEINNSGAITGSADVSDVDSRSFVFDRVMRPLPV